MKTSKHSQAKIRLFVEASFNTGFIDIDKEQTHYLHKVMRKQAGDTILIFNGTDGEYLARITAIDRKSSTIEIIEQTRKQKKEPDISLYFALVKNTAMKNIIRQATELGVSALQPVITKYTNASDTNIERLRSIAIEAAEQSERLSIPEFKGIKKLDDLINGVNKDLTIILCDESGSGRPINEALSKQKNGKYAVLIGPEGGFAKEELEKMRNCPYILPVGMGPRILKADTAVIAALSCYQSILGDWGEQPDFESK